MRKSEGGRRNECLDNGGFLEVVYKVGGSKGIGGDPFISLGFSLGCDTFRLAGQGGVLLFKEISFNGKRLHGE